jgi:protein TonB
MNIRTSGNRLPTKMAATTPQRPTGANVIVLSGDPALTSLLRDSLAGSHRVWRADDVTHAADLVVAAGNAVLLVDASLADHDTRTLVSTIHAQFPDLAIIVAGRRDDEAGLADLVSQGAIFRFLHKPASAERIRTFVDATQRREQQGADLPAAAPGLPLIAALRPQLSRLRLLLPRLDRARLRRYLRRSLLLLPLLAIIAALVTWKPWRQLSELLPERTQSAAVQSDPGQDPAVLRLLDAAGVALSQGRLVEPPGRNAVELYRAVLARHPGDPIATHGIERIADQFVIEAEHALADNDLPGLAGAIDALRSVQPDHPRLADFTATLARERNRRTAAPRTPTVADVTAGHTLDVRAARSDAGRVQSFVQLASERMASGHLVGGADSAHAYLFAGRRLDPADPGIRQGIQLLGALLENNARRELAAGHLDAASAWTHDAIALNHDRGALARLRSDLQAARLAGQREIELIPAAGSSADAAPAAISTVVLQPVATPAEPAAAPPPTIVPESQLQRRRFRSPDYPERAVLQRLEGWIEIEFTVACDGTTREPRILAAEPAGVFDRATLDALARWRYEPVHSNGVPVDQRVAMRLHFELAD